MFLYSKWRTLSLSTRQLLAQKFGIAKLRSTHVSGNEIVDDGYKIEDVEGALNIDAIQKYTGSESKDFSVLWDALIAKIEGRVVKVPVVPEVVETSTPSMIAVEVEPEEKPVTVEEVTPTFEVVSKLTPKKRGRPKK